MSRKPELRFEVTVVSTADHLLKPDSRTVDTVCMNRIDLHAEPLSVECHAVLSCYSVREATSRSQNPESNGWLDRVEDVPGVDRSLLTSAHGYLIAQGMLKFEITGRSVGLQYQMSPLGREALARGTAASAEADDATVRDNIPSPDGVELRDEIDTNCLARRGAA